MSKAREYYKQKMPTKHPIVQAYKKKKAPYSA